MPDMVPAPEIKSRLESLDVFRGATIAAMILVNNPGFYQTTYAPLHHADWHGWTFTDLIFPFFLWIAGVAMVLAFSKRTERGDSRAVLLAHAGRRAAIIFALGLFLNTFPRFDLTTLRIPGVLQRIAVCYLLASAVYLYTGVRGRIAMLVGVLSVYWALMMLVPVPGYGAGVLEKQGNFAQWVDGLVLSGHMYSATKTWDPEGIVSTLPAIGTVLFGIFTGTILRSARSASGKTVTLIAFGAVLAAAGQVMNVWLPINKNLWTSSFAVFMAGMATLVFAFCYWVIDVKGWRIWSRPFAIYGMNAIAVYVLSGLLARTLSMIKVQDEGKVVSLWSWIFRHVFSPMADPYNASLLFALSFVLTLYLVAYAMYRRHWFIKV